MAALEKAWRRYLYSYEYPLWDWIYCRTLSLPLFTPSDFGCDITAYIPPFYFLSLWELASLLASSPLSASFPYRAIKGLGFIIQRRHGNYHAPRPWIFPSHSWKATFLESKSSSLLIDAFWHLISALNEILSSEWRRGPRSQGNQLLH